MQGIAIARTAVLISALLHAGPVLAATITVPGDYPDVQTAIDNASPGDTIVVQGGSWETITIDKALAIIGDPAPTFLGSQSGTGLEGQSPITLAGPGSGRVSLENVIVGGNIPPLSYNDGAAGVSGGGFAALYVYDSTIEAPFLSLPAYVPSFGSPGIETTVPLVWIERSSVTASRQWPTDAPCTPNPAPTAPGLDAPGSTAVILDSTVTGGSFFMALTVCGSTCPPTCPPQGGGGPGVACNILYESNSSLVGGSGADWYTGTGHVYCCTAANGDPFVAAARILMPSDLGPLTGGQKVGQTLDLSWSTPGSSIALYLAFSKPVLPTPHPSGGYVFFGSHIHYLGVLPSPLSIGLNVPPSPLLVGIPFGFQILDLSTHVVSRPVSGVLMP
jgi:hypothetical protein